MARSGLIVVSRGGAPAEPRARWSPDELATLRAVAPLGAKMAMKELPGRSLGSVKNAAWKHGILLGKASPDGRSMGNRTRGRLPVPKHAHPFVRRLFEEMNRQRATLYEVADQSGVHWQTISGWRWNGCNPKLENLIAAMNVLGLDLVVRTINEDAREEAA